MSLLSTEQIRAIDSIFAPWDSIESPGAALAIIKDSRVAYQRGYGAANLEYQIPITPKTIFHVASVSKQFTAFAVLLLADGGQLALDEDIHKYLPEVPNLGQQITIRHLLHHTSGLRDQWELLMMAGWRLDDVITLEHIWKMVKRQKELNFPPGSEYLYCNTGYTLLSEIVARVSGMSFREFTRHRIFQPLGMDDTHFHDDHEEIVANRAYSYSTKRDGGLRKSVLSYANVGATSLFTTADDLSKWLLNFEQHTVGSDKVFAEMHKRFTLTDGREINYACGLSWDMHRDQPFVGHSGADAGFRSYCGRFPELGLGIIILSNLASSAPGNLALKVADALLGDSQNTALDAHALELTAYTGEYLLPLEGNVATINMNNGVLSIAIDDGDDLELTPVAPHIFRAEAINTEITFKPETDGAVNSLIAKTDSQSFPGQRVQLLKLDHAQLAQYAGEYYSDELGVTYTLVPFNRGMLVKQHRHPDAEVIPVGEDLFQGKTWRMGKLEFSRGEAGVVTGFRLSSGRVRNLRFSKAAPTHCR